MNVERCAGLEHAIGALEDLLEGFGLGEAAVGDGV